MTPDGEVGTKSAQTRDRLRDSVTPGSFAPPEGDGVWEASEPACADSGRSRICGLTGAPGGSRLAPCRPLSS